jgi:hypothetical protein
MLDRFNGVTFQRPRSDILNALLSLPAVAGESSLLAKTLGVRSLDTTPFVPAPDFEKIEGRA